MERFRDRCSGVLTGLILVALIAYFFGGEPLLWTKARWETCRSRQAYTAGNYEQALARANVATDECPNYRLAHYY